MDRQEKERANLPAVLPIRIVYEQPVVTPAATFVSQMIASVSPGPVRHVTATDAYQKCRSSAIRRMPPGYRRTAEA